MLAKTKTKSLTRNQIVSTPYSRLA